MSENQTNPVEEEERHRFRLMELENMIREHLRTGKFFLVAAALREIDDEKLYAYYEHTIYEYAKGAFGFNKRTTNTYLCSASVYESIVEDPSLPVPVNISHIRALFKYTPEVRRKIWKEVCDTDLTITEDLVTLFMKRHESGIPFKNIQNEFYTPKSIITAAKKVIGKSIFDLDPASCDFANNYHDDGIARIIFDESTNGLTQHWFGDVWLSPPIFTTISPITTSSSSTSSSSSSSSKRKSSSGQQVWFELSEKKFLSKEVNSVFILLRVDFSSLWFHRSLNYPHVFFSTALNFQYPTGKEKLATDTSYYLVYLGEKITDFVREFGMFGPIPGWNSWTFSVSESIQAS